MTGTERPAEYKGETLRPMRGRSIKGLLSGKVADVYGADEIVGAEMLGGKWVRQGDFKAALVTPPYGDGQWHLFNLAEDPGETRDLAAEMPELLQELQTAWEQYADEVGVVMPSKAGGS